MLEGIHNTMSSKNRILFISWQGCMGHITRDVAIAQEIHKLLPEVELVWLASPMATKILQEIGEQLLTESNLSADYNSLGDKIVDGFGLNLMKYVRYGKKLWEQNVELFKQVQSRNKFDLVIGDEIYELIYAITERRLHPKQLIVMIHDFFGGEAMSWNPLERLLMSILNRKCIRTLEHPSLRHFFVGEFEDVPDQKAGLLLPNWRDLATKYVKFLGYVIRFDPSDYRDKAAIRTKLGYGPEMLVICALGGASIGKGLLELCGKAYPIMKERIPDLRMIAVGGALFSPDSVKLPSEVTIRDYVPNLYEHFAASDLVIVVGGGTSTIELTALRCPFIYFPLEQQFDQQIHIPRRLDRHKAGIRMTFSETTPMELADLVIENIDKDTHYANIPVDGAKKAAKLIGDMLQVSNSIAEV